MSEGSSSMKARGNKNARTATSVLSAAAEDENPAVALEVSHLAELTEVSEVNTEEGRSTRADTRVGLLLQRCE